MNDKDDESYYLTVQKGGKRITDLLTFDQMKNAVIDIKMRENRIFVIAKWVFFTTTLYCCIEYDRKTLTVVDYHEDFSKVSISSYSSNIVMLYTSSFAQVKILDCSEPKSKVLVNSNNL